MNEKRVVYWDKEGDVHHVTHFQAIPELVFNELSSLYNRDENKILIIIDDDGSRAVICNRCNLAEDYIRWRFNPEFYHAEDNSATIWIITLHEDIRELCHPDYNGTLDVIHFYSGNEEYPYDDGEEPSDLCGFEYGGKKYFGIGSKTYPLASIKYHKAENNDYV